MSWTHRHLLGLEHLSAADLDAVFRTAERFVGVPHSEKLPHLKGKQVANLFFENSTRTRMSFGLAARRLSADVIEFTASGSSMAKGESIIDTAMNIEAMGVDVVVVRHSSPGAPHLLARHLKAHVINAGDGAHEHPTRLLDISPSARKRNRSPVTTVGLIGDIASQVARSGIRGLTRLRAGHRLQAVHADPSEVATGVRST